MRKDISQYIVLVEDRAHLNLVRRYLEQAGVNPRRIRSDGLPANRKSGEQFVREYLPKFLRAMRSRAARASTALVVMTDADELSVRERMKRLEQEVAKSGGEPRADDEAVCILIPKWHVETWVACLRGTPVDESDKETYKRQFKMDSVPNAAKALREWVVGPIPVFASDSLVIGVTELREKL